MIIWRTSTGQYIIPPNESVWPFRIFHASRVICYSNVAFFRRDTFASQRIELGKCKPLRASSYCSVVRGFTACTRSVLSVESVLTPLLEEFASVHRFAHWHRALSSPRRVIARITYATMNYHQRPERSAPGYISSRCSCVRATARVRNTWSRVSIRQLSTLSLVSFVFHAVFILFH